MKVNALDENHNKVPLMQRMGLNKEDEVHERFYKLLLVCVNTSVSLLLSHSLMPLIALL